MPKQRSPDSYKAEELYKQGMKLVEIASQLNVSEGTVRSWKNRYNFDGKSIATLQKNNRNVAKKNKERTEAIEEEVSGVLENPDLTDKQKLFCLHYIRCFNATKAYQKAYECDYITANAHGYEMLSNVVIRNEIQRLKRNRMNREMLDESDIFQKYMDIAFADITDFVEFGQEEVPVMTMYGPAKVEDKETGEKKMLTKMVNTIRFKESHTVDGTLIAEVKQGRDGASIKLADRMKALNWISEHMDMATEEQKARIEQIRAKTVALTGGKEEETEDDGFLEALKGTVNKIWEE